MSGDIGVGKILGGDSGRDAIHIAVAPMRAASELEPGQHVGLLANDTVGVSDTPIGIVDPFLKTAVRSGQRFYLFLYPGTITSLRHEWIHPAFVGQVFAPPNESYQWISDFAAELDQTYNRLMEAARQWLDAQDYTYDNSETYKRVDNKKWPIFWEHYEKVTGTKVADHTATFFTCSC